MLAIFYWGLHYRLQQYQAAHTHDRTPLAKMWLEDRGSPAVPAFIDALDTHGSQRHATDHTGFSGLSLLGLFLPSALFILYARRFGILQRPTFQPRWTPSPSLYSRPPPSFIWQ
jgi:hypothetical protein